MQKYDYIISGTGAAGLLLIYYMAKDSFFDQKKILLIDKEEKNKNDRTWCFWEQGTGEWDSILKKEWEHIYFGSPDFSKTIDIRPYHYKMLRGKDFYDFVLNFISQKSNIQRVQEKVIRCTDEGDIVEVETDKQLYLTDTVFNSIPFNDNYKKQQKYPLLNQHFIGWFVKTEVPTFDPMVATFMDFNVAQKGNTRFMYMLPMSSTEALFEYTLFSEKILDDQEYEVEIVKYLEEKGITDFQITEKEQGCIPMSSYRFQNENSQNILHIGTAGGWTKASTGFTFSNSEKKIKELIPFLKTKNNVTRFDPKTKFWYYDVLFLDVLYQQNEIGASLFSRLFKKNKTEKILKFLSEKTSFAEDLKIMSTMPSLKFMKMIWKRII